MKDLKHLIYFESLLDSAHNELVRQAKEEGQLALGFTCYHMPEVLLNVDNCFSVRLRAPNTGSIDIASYYMSNYTCEYCRAVVERAIEGGYNFLDGLCGVDACAQMNRCMENIELLKCIDKPNFFVTHADIPYKYTDYTLDHYVTQMQNRVLNTMHEKLGVDISDAALRDSVARHNEICKIITELGELRKKPNPPITGYEFHVINMVSFCCPQRLILPYLKETLTEVKKRKADAKPWYRCRVGIVGLRGGRPEPHKDARGGRGLHRFRPLLLRRAARPRGHRAERRGARPEADMPALPPHQRVSPLHVQRKKSPSGARLPTALPASTPRMA